LAEQVRTEQAGIINELRELRTNVDHIRDIVAMQQSYGRISAVVEPVQIDNLVEDALRMSAGGLGGPDIQIVRQYAPNLPEMILDKHRVLQILVNLIRNAKYACQESGRPDTRLTLRLTNGSGRVSISVSDNGVGIPRENLTRIFQHGFTTRKNGHGFGLHSGALAACELGGSLLAHSDGPGQGATFTLELPLSQKN
jgi:signal transduction histidine kinase